MVVPRFVEYWVLLLDILGFSERMADKTKRVGLAAAYHEVVNALSTLSNVRPEYVREWSDCVRVFSDSIFVFFGGHIPQNHPGSPHLLGATAREIMTRLWRRRIPHRGAIAFGPCHLDPAKNIFIGPAIVEAHRWERAQKWLGVSVAPDSLFEARGNIVGPAAGSVGIGRSSFVEARVSANGRDVTTWALNPFKRLIPSAVAGKEGDLLPCFIDCYEEAKRTAPRDVLLKYANTARFLISQGIGRKNPALSEIARS